jgi:heme oxygenase
MSHQFSPSLMLAMREATHDTHARLEKSLRIASPNADRDTYISYVRALWGWLAPIEERLWSGDWPENLTVARRAQKRFWLAEDLRHAGFGEAELIDMPSLNLAPKFASMAERYGWAYVIEGAQLGGQVLRKSLGPALHPWAPRWLEGYGDETSKNWKTFASYIDSLDDALIMVPAAQAACQAFTTLATWLEACGACHGGAEQAI